MRNFFKNIYSNNDMKGVRGSKKVEESSDLQSNFSKFLKVLG